MSSFERFAAFSQWFEDPGAAFGTSSASAEKSRAAPPIPNANTEELHRLRGDLLRRQQNPNWTEVEDSFRCAVAIAREQGTRGFELRAAVSLARLLSDHARRAEAQDLLAPVYAWFAEGFDTPDLKDAKALLDELT